MAPAQPDRRRDDPSVHIDAQALAEMLDRVGTSAAMAFAAVAVDALPDERDVLVATTSARSLARRLHVAKDTAAGVLALLVKRGYLRRLVQPRIGGRFAPARYVVRPPTGFTVVPCAAREDTAPSATAGRTTTTAGRAARRHRDRRSGRGKSSQLGLFGAVSEVPEGRSRP